MLLPLLLGQGGGGGGSASVAASLLTSGGDTVNRTSAVTASVSWDAGDMIVVALDMCYNDNATEPAWTCTATGLTFTLQLSVANSNYQRNHVFTAVAGSSGSGAITLSGANSYVFAYQVLRLRPTGGTIAAGTGQSGSTSTGATNSLGSLTGYDSDDYQLAFTMIGNSQTTASYNSMVGTPRAGWTEVGETIFGRTGGSANWGGFVHTQFGPQGGENTASVSDLYSYAITRMLVLPIAVTATGGGVSATSAVTLEGVTQSAAGVIPEFGTSAVTLTGVTQTATGQVAARGSSAVALDGVGQAAAGLVATLGASSITLEGVAQSATGTVGTAGVTGSSAITLEGIAPAAAGQVRVAGASAVQLAGVVQAGAGQQPAKGSSGVTLAGVTQVSAGQVTSRGTSSTTLAGVVQSGAGLVSVRGSSAVSLDGVTQEGTGLSGTVPPTPPERIVEVLAESRTSAVSAMPPRVVAAFADHRRTSVPAQSRTYVVEALNRVVYASEDTRT